MMLNISVRLDLWHLHLVAEGKAVDLHANAFHTSACICDALVLLQCTVTQRSVLHRPVATGSVQKCTSSLQYDKQELLVGS